MRFTFEPIGTIRSPYREKFGIPRQPGLVPEARAILKLKPELADATRELEKFSHVWILFVFHEAIEDGWNALVRPPRLGGKEKVGVFASRSPHRPNPIGMSAVALERVDRGAAGGPELHLKGVDLLDGTPVLDIKPYVPYADSVTSANEGWAETPQPKLTVEFSPEAAEACARYEGQGYGGLRALIERTFSLDPRPAHQARQDASYATRMMDFDVHWRTDGSTAVIEKIEDLRASSHNT